jgi:hypothetical protein
VAQTASEIRIMTSGSLQLVAKTEGTKSTGGHLPLSSCGSVTKLIWQIRKGDPAAAQELCGRYARRLEGLARANLRGKDLRIADEEDAVNSALAGFFLGAKRGQYTQLHDRDDLWHLLAKIVKRKAQELVREQRAKCRWPGRTDVPMDEITGRNPPPDLEVMANETIEHILSRLGSPCLRAIVLLKCEG